VSDLGVGVDPTTPAVARMYDYWLGGKDNFAADRDTAGRIEALLPDVPPLAHANRRFLVRTVRFLAERGVTQFIDLGTGLPTSPNVHEIAREVQPGARVVYTDIDAMVIAHSRAMATFGGVVSVHADMRDPCAVLGDPDVRRLIDFTKPVALLMIAVLPYLGAGDDLTGILARYRAGVPRGSYFAVSVATDEGLDLAVTRNAENILGRASVPAHFWPRQEIDDMLTAIDPVRPGVVPINEWRAAEPPLNIRMLGAVGRFRPE
jgi:hypothetical protein